MVKRFFSMSLFLAILVTALIYFMGMVSDPTLAGTVKIDEKKDNFILHIRVEDAEKGFRILRSLEYRGDKPVTVHHPSPLVSVSLNENTHTFTGSPVEKELKKGEIYHITQPLVYEGIEKGNHQLFVKALFTANGKQIEIDCHRKLVLH